MKLQDELQISLAHCNYNDVAQHMGYSKSGRGKAAQRITHVLADPYMGLNSGSFDFKFSNDEFLTALCEVLGIDVSDHKQELDAIHDEYTDRRERYKAHVFIDTNFKRQSQTLISLACLHGQRFIQLPYEIRFKDLFLQVEYVQSIVKQHYIENDGAIGVWGLINRYIFNYADGCSVSLSPDGVILEDEPVVNISRASVGVGNADITKLLVGKNDS